ncbi:MAG: hypothetical protein IT350_11580 [Deltaproteobacteria bacterium]|nr:hypothetical protein [Deltaproteobacteria bacterium]
MPRAFVRVFMLYVFFLTFVACRAGTGAESRLPNPPAERTAVAPVFEHGDGSERSESPTSIGEDDALSLIREVLARYGLTQFGGRKEFPNFTYMTRHEKIDYSLAFTPPPYGAFGHLLGLPGSMSDYHELIRRKPSPTQFRRPLSFDLYDARNGIGVEYVSVADADAIAAYGQPPLKRAGPIRTLHAALIVQDAARQLAGPQVVVVFYDPLFRLEEHIPELAKRPSMTDREVKGEYLRYNFTHLALTQPRLEKERAGMRRLLEMQVEDFAWWLDSRERGERCRFEDREDVFVPYLSTYLYASIEAEGGYCGPAKHGLWTTRHTNGVLKDAGAYDAGEKTGLWTTFHTNGVTKSVGEYRDGRKQGPWVEFWENGVTKETASYDGGELTGSYFHRGGEFVENDRWLTATLPDGAVKATTFDKNKWEIPLKNGKPHGTVAYESRDFSRLTRGRYRDGQPVGRWTEVDRHGCIARDGRFRDGQQDGIWRFEGYDRDSEKCFDSMEVPFSRGLVDGLLRYGPKHPCPVFESYVEGKELGVTLQSLARKYVSDRDGGGTECYVRELDIHPEWDRIGRHFEFDENSCVLVEGEFHRGDKREGRWIFRETNPTTGECVVVKEEDYRNGLSIETVVPRTNFEKIEDIPGNLTGHLSVSVQTDRYFPSLIGIEYVVEDPLPIDVEAYRIEGNPVGIQKFRMKNGRYVRECNHGPPWDGSHPEAEPYMRGAYPDSPPPPEQPGTAHCRTWTDPAHQLLEDAVYWELPADRFGYMDLGPFRSWYENGRPKADIQLPTGHAVQYWPNGRKSREGEFLDSARQGEWTFWWASGHIWLQANFQRSASVGRWTYWYDGGKRAFECDFGDEMKGAFRCSFWRKNGTKIGDVLYEDGEKKTWTCWDERGRPADCSWGQWKVLYGTMEGPRPDSQSQ